MKPTTPALAAGCALLALGVLLALPAAAATVAISEQEQADLGIEVAAATRRADAGTGTLAMRVAFSPDAEWVIRSPLPGFLHRTLVQQGDRVSAGQPLFVVRSPDFVALQRDYLQAHAELAMAKAAWQRDARLREAGSIADRRWQETEYAYRAALADLGGLEGQLTLAGLSAEDLATLRREAAISPDLVLRAPADAVVLGRPAPLGSQLDGSENLVRLGEPGKLVLHGVVARTAAAHLGEGTRLAQPGGEGRAVVTFVSAVLDTESQTVDVRAVPEAGVALQPGELSEWSVLAGEAVLMLPASAVVRLDDADVVYVAVPGGFEPRPVQVRSTAGGGWLVLAGLEEGERVAVKGTAVLKGASLGLGGGEG